MSVLFLDDGVRLFFGGETYIAVLTFSVLCVTLWLDSSSNLWEMLRGCSTSWLLRLLPYSQLAGYRQLVYYFINQKHVLHG